MLTIEISSVYGFKKISTKESGNSLQRENSLS